MAEAITSHSEKRYAVVTGRNRGIGYEICKQLASQGVIVVLTDRDEKKGDEALKTLKNSCLLDNVFFHQLDVGEPASIASLVDFIQSKFGKLDILVNNAGFVGVLVEGDALILQETILGNGLRIAGQLLSNEWAIRMLSDGESLTEERVDEVVTEFLRDFKDGTAETKGWPPTLTAYIVSKVAINAYTRILAKKFPTFCVNCLCPGYYCKTDITCNTGFFTAAEGAEGPVKLALLPAGCPSGLYFLRDGVTTF